MTLQSVSRILVAHPAAVRSWRITLCVLVVAVTWLALTPAPPAPIDTGWDKANHLLAFVALSASACLGFPGSRMRLLAVAAALLAFGGLIELLQMALTSRSAEWGDLLADLAGIALGTLLARGLGRAGQPHRPSRSRALRR